MKKYKEFTLVITRHRQLCDVSFGADRSGARVLENSLAALRLKDPRQTQAKLRQLAYCPIVGDNQPGAQHFSSHHHAGDTTVRLMPI